MLEALAAALIPALGDVIKSATRRFLGASARPRATNPSEWCAMMQAETERLKALAAIDNPGGNVSRWVADLRASSRYLIAYVVTIFVLFSEAHAFGLKPSPALEQAAASVWFFLFGERAYRYMRGGE
ncbi:MAG: hypothetical protein D6771_04855 [Zetaproteobacteria bacterium]|nr:MAG: hypothetical protein D6771_04855 [Zetaproteobacteria bacterium]